MSDTSRFFSSPENSSVKAEAEEPTPKLHDTLPSSPQLDFNKSNGLFVPDENESDSADDIDQKYILFESQIQAIIPDICPVAMYNLYTKHNAEEDAVIAAVNEYFEQDAFKPEQVVSAKPKTHKVNTLNKAGGNIACQLVNKSTSRSSQSTQRLDKENIKEKPMPRGVQWRRFIGSLQVSGWATRPTVSPVPYGTRLTVSKSIDDQNAIKRRKFALSSYVKLIQDYNNPSKRKEIGRLPEEIASILYNLIDHSICDFDVTMVLCDGRLQTGDTFIVQLDCFLTSRIFDKYEGRNAEEELKLLRNHRNFDNGAQVTPDEQYIKDRQVAMLRLFNKLNFQVVHAAVEPEDEIIDLESDDLDEQLRSSGSYKPSPPPSDEMNLNQLKEFYRITQTEKVLETLPETETNDNFKLDLRPYQKQGLTWMLRSERELENDAQSSQMNPLWKEFRWPKDRSWAVMRKESLRPRFEGDGIFYGNLYSGEFSLEKPVLKNMCKGGILADEMGLGKTVSTLALLHNAPFDRDYDRDKSFHDRYAYGTTLIILPTSLLAQWQDEFQKANNDSSSLLLYYGDDTDINIRSLLCSKNPPMCVLTTYGTVQHEFARYANVKDITKGLFSVKFFRLVLDEGHNIRNRMAKTTKACYALQSSRKWLLTGTPIINRLDDLYSLIKFLELEPWANISYWNTFITIPFAKKDYKQALDVVQSILAPILLRRTKNMKKNGKPLVELPSKEVVLERIKFSPRERRLYDWFLARAEHSVSDGIRRGDILKKYTQILVHILRLRQICCHSDLVRSGGDEMDEDISSKSVTPLDIPKELLEAPETFPSNEMNLAVQKIRTMNPDVSNLECSICISQPIPFDEISFTECGHSFCLNCILEHCNYQEMKGNKLLLCPNCKTEISSSKLLQPKRQVKANEGGSYSLQQFDDSLRSAKLNALLSHLRMIKETCPNEKIVVFSQFSTFLDIMETEISKEQGITVFKFDGRLSFEKRKKVLEQFKKPSDALSVLLLSLKAGGVGLNLTEASRVFMCDPWWSPSVEDQAIDRVHRIGQENSVKVVRFIMEGSIEEKMLKIQERKRTIGEAVEAEEEERRRRRVEEIQTLFEST